MLALSFALAALSSARMSGPRYVPVERVIANTTAYMAAHPDDVHAHYVLGRAHNFAYVVNQELASTHVVRDAAVSAELPELASTRSQLVQGTGDKLWRWTTKDGERVKEPVDIANRDSKVALEHARQALVHLRIANGREDDSRYVLAWAYALESLAHIASHLETVALLDVGAAPDFERARELRITIRELVDTNPSKRDAARAALLASVPQSVHVLDQHRVDPDPKLQLAVATLLTDYWCTESIAAYTRAFEHSAANDAFPESRDRNHGVPDTVAREAGESLLRLRAERESKPAGDEIEVRIRDYLKRLNDLPTPSYISPIVFSLGADLLLPELLDERTRVKFDIDGDGLPNDCPWVAPHTAFLVWQPDPEEPVTSGMQLFGSVTWQLFFENGYRALDALDDDRDGWLAGTELVGLRAWNDRDGDGVWNSGERIELDCLGIKAIHTRDDAAFGLSPTSMRGLLFQGGSTRATYDWVLETN